MKELWNSITDQAKSICTTEPILENLITNFVLKFDDLPSALTAILVSKLAFTEIATTKLEEQLYIKLSNILISDQIHADLLFFNSKDPACNNILTPLLFFKGFQGLALHRVAHACWHDGAKNFASLLQSRGSEIFGMDIHPAAVIAGGVMIDHGTGIVIGETATIGPNVSLFQGVTLGGRGDETGKRHPDILEGATIYASSTVLGNIEIGKNSIVAAGSLVLKSVLQNETVAGIPARRVRSLSQNDIGWDPGNSSL